MKPIISQRRLSRIVAGALACAAGMLLIAQDYTQARDFVAKVQQDLQRAADFTRNKQKERDRYQDVQRRLSDFDRDLAKGKWDKGKLDQAIDELKDVVKNNTLESHDRDTLSEDLANLRTLRNGR